MTFFAGAALIPAFVSAKVPFRLDWAGFAGAYWVGTAAQSICAAAVLYVLSFPFADTLRPVRTHYEAQKPRLIVLAVFGAVMIWQFGWQLGIMIIVDAIAIAELVDRSQGDFKGLLGTVRRVMLPAAYLFLGLLVVFSYNHLIASVRFAGAFDSFFSRMDLLLFRGISVTNLAHTAVKQLPLSVFRLFEFIYYSLYAQVGATVIFTGFLAGRKYAFQYVGTLLTAYYLALIIFFLWPSIGPFAICPLHVAQFPHVLATYQTQETILTKARLLWTHKPAPGVDVVDMADYYIAFPCMHVALPFIGLWFLRVWKRLAACLLLYSSVLILSIVLLEWHYLVDLIGGLMVAALAIALNHKSVKEMRIVYWPAGGPVGQSAGTLAPSKTGSDRTQLQAEFEVQR